MRLLIEFDGTGGVSIPNSAASYPQSHPNEGGSIMAANPIPELSLETVRTPEETVVRCSGRITSGTSALLQTTVRSLLPESNCVALDLTDVSYMDSSGLGAIIGLYLSAKRQHCGLKFIKMNQRLQELFRITKLASVFEGHGDYLGYTPD
ncbi:MAG: STAS domain-containing protein [Terriglobales bacterium]